MAAHVHYNVALSSFRQDLTNITAENSHALFSCATLIVMISFAQSCDSLSTFSSTTNQECGPGVMKWLSLLRGVKSVLTETGEWVHTGPMAPLLYMRGPEGYSSNIGKVDEDVTAHLDSLSAAFVECAEPRVADVCVAATELLRKSFAGMAFGSDSVFFWPVLVHKDYMSLLELNIPEALMVLASYCVLLHTKNWCWWIEGWPANMLRKIEGIINEQWRAWLWWPLHVISNEDNGRRKENVLIVTEGACCQ